MTEMEARFAAAERYELFTPYHSGRNFYLYGKPGYQAFRHQRITDKAVLAFMEKPSSGREGLRGVL